MSIFKKHGHGKVLEFRVPDSPENIELVGSKQAPNHPAHRGRGGGLSPGQTYYKFADDDTLEELHRSLACLTAIKTRTPYVFEKFVSSPSHVAIKRMGPKHNIRVATNIDDFEAVVTGPYDNPEALAAPQQRVATYLRNTLILASIIDKAELFIAPKLSIRNPQIGGYELGFDSFEDKLEVTKIRVAGGIALQGCGLEAREDITRNLSNNRIQRAVYAENAFVFANEHGGTLPEDILQFSNIVLGALDPATLFEVKATVEGFDPSAS